MSYCDVAKARQQVYNAARPAMHSAQHCTVPSIPQRAALHCVQRDESRKKMPYMCHARAQMCQNVCVTCVCFPNVLLRRAQFYSPALRCAVRSIVQPPAQFLGPRAAEQPVLQRLETLQKVCALVAFSTAHIHKIIQLPLPAQHCTQHCTVSSATRQHCTQHCSAQRDESRKKMPYMCHATIQRAA
jgi:hypothetical protein